MAVEVSSDQRTRIWLVPLKGLPPLVNQLAVAAEEMKQKRGMSRTGFNIVQIVQRVSTRTIAGTTPDERFKRKARLQY